MADGDEKVQGDQKPKTRMEQLEDLVMEQGETIALMAKKLTDVEKKAGGKAGGLFGGKRERVAIKDTTTGTIYPSKARCGKALHAEVGVEPSDTFAWYKLIAKFPERFLEMAADSKEASEAWAKDEAEKQAEVDAANAKLEEERKAAEEAEKKAAGAPNK